MEWEHKDLWKRIGRNFCVEVERRHTTTSGEEGEGPQRWCVYAYIYPDHPHFSAFKGNQMGQSAATMLPLHGGPTLLRWHTDNKGAVCSVQVGADYHHLHDEAYTHMATREDAGAIFRDAEELFNWLRERA